MVNGIHDNGTYIKTYIRNANKTGIDQFEIHYTKLNSHKITIKNTKYLTSLEDISNTRFLVPIIECKGVSQELCDTIDKLVSDIEADLRNNIIFYNPVKFKIEFRNLKNDFENETTLASTSIDVYYYLRLESSNIKCNYPQSLVKQFITNGQINYVEHDFTISFSTNEDYYIENMNELTTKRQGYDLKLILYHEIIHGLGIKTEITSIENYLKENEVNPSEFTNFVGENSYMVILREPTIYDNFVRNENISYNTLAEELGPFVEAFPKIKNKLEEYGSDRTTILDYTKTMNEIVESNITVVNAAMQAYGMVSHDGLYFKGKLNNIPLQTFENDFENGVSIIHTKHCENTLESDKYLLDWKIPNGKIICNANNTSGIMGPEILDMLNTIGWPTVNDSEQQKYIIEESIDSIFSLHSNSSSLSIPFFSIFNICILLYLFLWH
ncbi:hypothetical protein H8356DRAFT_1041013 [Neocallimastix lanati (nom. inval.)]|jgi:hypothetical protein|uniref:Uncharacterized protein n=1 Tax=Neocallimastix californiae TaxID=1754190 RepID=A0A1Y2EN15_9FUNG|nr:hypothetical protein H8356DRAFT_1041013 [Neocallimastix sp. JGI-2020a]ORY72626.1 hypothetical protein LY90DRAFT_666989 [Neocallimastix californiae]|eukprot:ORY72626.1 hypothetical protein LY90DRAFT_666989 [Neocallimastix californiae]